MADTLSVFVTGNAHGHVAASPPAPSLAHAHSHGSYNFILFSTNCPSVPLYPCVHRGITTELARGRSRACASHFYAAGGQRAEKIVIY